jgi:hypothetical protein
VDRFVAVTTTGVSSPRIPLRGYDPKTGEQSTAYDPVGRQMIGNAFDADRRDVVYNELGLPK